MDKLFQNVDAPVDDLTDLVQEFYIKLGKRMDTNTMYKGMVDGNLIFSGRLQFV